MLAESGQDRPNLERRLDVVTADYSGIALASSFIGRKLVRRIDPEKFPKMVLVAIILASIKFIFNGLQIER